MPEKFDLLPPEQVDLMLDVVVTLANDAVWIGETNQRRTNYFAGGDPEWPGRDRYFAFGLMKTEDRERLKRWLENLESDKTFREVQLAFNSIQVDHVAFRLKRNGKRVVKEHEITCSAPDMYAALGWMLGHILGAGAAPYIRRCGYCERFYARRPNPKEKFPGCTPAHSTNLRVAAMRKHSKRKSK